MSEKLALPIEHIKVGNFLWYGGNTSMFGWSCPAKIMTVKGGKFTVMSLDDMKVQSQTYAVVMGPHEPESRTSMRAIPESEARNYMIVVLEQRRDALRHLEETFQRESLAIEETIVAIVAELSDAP